MTDSELRAWAQAQGVQLNDQDSMSQLRSLKADADEIAEMVARRKQVISSLSAETRASLADMLRL
jgi:hypothetical protein